MAQIVADDFTRADSTGLGANWTQTGLGGATIDVIGNQAGEDHTSNFGAAYYSGASWTGGVDQYAEMALTVLQSGKDVGPAVRMNGSPFGGTGGVYLFVINDTDAAIALGSSSFSVALYKCVNTTFTQLGASVTGVTVSANDVLRIEVQGTTIRGVIQGSTIITRTDSAVASGNPGFYISGGFTSRFDLFAAGDFGGGGGGTTDTGLRFRRSIRPAPFKPLGDAFRTDKYRTWR